LSHAATICVFLLVACSADTPPGDAKEVTEKPKLDPASLEIPKIDERYAVPLAAMSRNEERTTPW
jgi:hypothetical protein